MSTDDDLPPLKARPTERDKKNMEAWVNRKLDAIDDALTEVYWASMGDVAAREQRDKAFEEFTASDAAEIHAAEHGDIEPLRAKYPRLARFLICRSAAARATGSPAQGLHRSEVRDAGR